MFLRHLRFMRLGAPTAFMLFDGADPAAPAPAPAPAPVVLPPAAAPLAPGETAEQRVDRLQRALADTRAEAAQYRINARQEAERTTALTAELEQARAATDSAVQTVRTNADSQVERERSLRLDAELKAAAVSAGLIDPDLLPLIPRGTIKVDAAGNVVGLAEAIAAFKTSKPSYFRDGALAPAPVRLSSGLAPIAPQPGATPPITTVKDIPRGTPEGKREYNKAKQDGLAALRRQGG